MDVASLEVLDRRLLHLPSKDPCVNDRRIKRTNLRCVLHELTDCFRKIRSMRERHASEMKLCVLRILVYLVCMTLGRCPLSIFCSRGTPPKSINPRKRLRGRSATNMRVKVTKLQYQLNERIQCHLPLSSQYGTYKTVKARFWPWLSGKSP